MSLFYATLLTGIALIIKGLVLLQKPKWIESKTRHFLRSNAAAVFFFGGGAIWFLWHISQLGASDFGEYRGWLLILFATATILSFFHVKDFLAVRGWAILIMLIGKVLLDSAYMEEIPSRLFLVSLVYIMILGALYLGVAPYRARDLYDWFFARRVRIRYAAIGTLTYGMLLSIIAFTY